MNVRVGCYACTSTKNLREGERSPQKALGSRFRWAAGLGSSHSTWRACADARARARVCVCVCVCAGGVGPVSGEAWEICVVCMYVSAGRCV